MSELIKKDDAINAIHNIANKQNDTTALVAALKCESAVKHLAIEQEKHGEWIECFEDEKKQIAGDKCTACGFEHYGNCISHYNYCPNCGAKMKGNN